MSEDKTEVEVEIKHEHDHEPSLSEKAVNWAKAIGLIGAAVIACYGAFIRGEPDAALSYKELSKEFTVLKTEFVKQQTFVDGFLAGLNQATQSLTIIPASQPVSLPKTPISKPGTKAPLPPPLRDAGVMAKHPSPAISAPHPVIHKEPVRRPDRVKMRELPSDLDTLKRTQQPAN